jgi:hypothetical protein
MRRRVFESLKSPQMRPSFCGTSGWGTWAADIVEFQAALPESPARTRPETPDPPPSDLGCRSPALCGTLVLPAVSMDPGETIVKKDEFYQYALEAFRPAESLLKMVPSDKLEWKPGPSFMSMGQLICHLGDGIGTELRMVLTNSWPKPEEMSEAMKNMPTCTPQEALAKLEKDKGTLREVLSSLTERDFTNKLVKVPWGWEFKMEKMALNFRDHFVHHKMQLFTYLKLLGFSVNTDTLYFG